MRLQGPHVSSQFMMWAYRGDSKRDRNLTMSQPSLALAMAEKYGAPV